MANVEYIGGSVSRATFAKDVVNREPVDSITNISRKLLFVFYFTELKGMMGETVVHRWERHGELVREVCFQIGGPRWRIWSSEAIHPDSHGDWKVSVLDTRGRLLKVSHIGY